MKQWFSKVALVVFAALAPIHAVIVSVGVLVMGDLVTGVWAAYKRGEEIKSSGLRRTLSKLVVYNIAIISGFMVQQYMIEDLVPIVKIIAGVIGLVELKSILENANKITGVDLFKEVIARLGSKNDTKGQ
jgi:uncharacterized membrane protein